MFARLRARLAAEKGQSSERAAEQLLHAAGLKTLARNWRAKTGELDLVMADGDTLVVVEVRARQHGDFGGALGSISAAKLRRIQRTTLGWLQQQPAWQKAPLRFDVVSFEQHEKPEWIQAAFDAATDP